MATQLKDKDNNNIFPVVEDSGSIPSVGAVHILGLGNSYMGDTAKYLGGICSRLGVDNVNFQYISQASAPLYLWAGYTAHDDSVHTFDLITAINGGSLFSGGGNLYSILSQNWDIIVLQQKSVEADNYASFIPYLAHLIARIREICPNKKVKFAFHMTWETEYVSQDYGTQSALYSDIVATIKSMLADYGQVIDYLIPTGTGIQNIRATSLNDNVNNFSENDGAKWHLQEGVGEYVASCTFFEGLIAKVCGKNVSMYNDNAVIAVDETKVGAVSVTAENRDICHRAAGYAVVQPFAVAPASILEGE